MTLENLVLKKLVVGTNDAEAIRYLFAKEIGS